MRVVVRIACVALVFALCANGRADEKPGVMLNVVWSSPNDRSRLDFSFARDPMVIVLPGDALNVSASAPDGPCTVTVVKDGRPFRQDASLAFTAPESPGIYYIPLLITSPGLRRDAQLCIVVPYRAAGRKVERGVNVHADGQEIGEYRHTSRSGNRKVKENPESYQPPVWWFRLTDQNRLFEIVPGVAADELVAPAEDTGRQHTDMPPVAYPMWKAIWTVKRAVGELGIPPEAVKLISVFRSPAYNRGIGSNAFGRHIYGDAFDFYISLDGGEKAADLNHDGKLDRRDAYPVVGLIENLQADGEIPMGGVGIYNHAAGDHEVTMHVDLRGHRATWGYYYSAGGRRSEFSWQSERFADLDREDERKAAAVAAKEGRKYAPPRREPLR